ncbi:MAG: hypothetical protein HBSAPP04_20730 [Ignavibacteriaceae bacterium]|nr:MAG: hypothetical protein HBSAPP04_20730 [Ignavibacteriaceae bacterium]
MNNTKILMSVTAVTLGSFGFLSSFFSVDLLTHTKIGPSQAADMFIQMMSALYMGFAIMNWMQREAIIGGIYARPLAMGNFFHFVIGTFALGKVLADKPHLPGMWILTGIYFLFAVAFALVLFTHPKDKEKAEG